jgi:RNA-directed DNA polymerase
MGSEGSVQQALGFSFTSGREPRRRIALQALVRLKSRVRQLTRCTKGDSLKQITKGLASIIWLLPDSVRVARS